MESKLCAINIEDKINKDYCAEMSKFVFRILNMEIIITIFYYSFSYIILFSLMLFNDVFFLSN